MTKEKLEERIKELEVSRDQLRANLLAHEGAIQECQNWLEKLPKTEEIVKDE